MGTKKLTAVLESGWHVHIAREREIRLGDAIRLPNLRVGTPEEEWVLTRTSDFTVLSRG